MPPCNFRHTEKTCSPIQSSHSKMHNTQPETAQPETAQPEKPDRQKQKRKLPSATTLLILKAIIGIPVLTWLGLQHFAAAPSADGSDNTGSQTEILSTPGTDTADNSHWLDASYPLANASNAADGQPAQTTVPRQHLQNGLIINFWATWCPPCVRELPLFNQSRQELLSKGQSPAPVIAIAIDNPESVQRFLQNTPLPNLTIAVAGMEGLATLRQAGNATGQLPYTLALDSAGNIVHQHTGELTARQVRQLQSSVQSQAQQTKQANRVLNTANP